MDCMRVGGVRFGSPVYQRTWIFSRKRRRALKKGVRGMDSKENDIVLLEYVRLLGGGESRS